MPPSIQNTTRAGAVDRFAALPGWTVDDVHTGSPTSWAVYLTAPGPIAVTIAARQHVVGNRYRIDVSDPECDEVDAGELLASLPDSATADDLVKTVVALVDAWRNLHPTPADYAGVADFVGEDLGDDLDTPPGCVCSKLVHAAGGVQRLTVTDCPVHCPTTAETNGRCCLAGYNAAPEPCPWHTAGEIGLAGPLSVDRIAGLNGARA